MESNPNVHDNRNGPRRPPVCKTSLHNKFVATQALLVSSEPLSTHGGRASPDPHPWPKSRTHITVPAKVTMHTSMVHLSRKSVV